MHQRWRRLLFLHWDWDPAAVQAVLPAGLTVDTWENRAWLGVVPFAMEGVRPRFLPAVRGISDFPELNVRTYVRDARGRAGVWFQSLDCAQPLAVMAAQIFFGLPYFRAEMRERVGAGGRVDYECRRRGTGVFARFKYGGAGAGGRAGEGTLEEFLVERYRLFAVRGGRLLTGEVWHDPYSLRRAEVAEWSDLPLRQAGFDPRGGAPAHAVFAPGVDVHVFGVEAVK